MLKKIDFSGWIAAAVLVALMVFTSSFDRAFAGGITTVGAARGRNADITSLQNLHGSAGIVSNTIAGLNAGDSIPPSTIYGAYNTIYGSQAYRNGSATGNSAFGYAALFSDNGSDSQNLGGYNTAIGGNALHGLTTGTTNTAVGYSSGYSLTSGYYNVIVGNTAFVNNISGSYDVAVGVSAGHSSQTGSNNTYLGTSSGPGTSDHTGAGNNNVFLGASSGEAQGDVSNYLEIGAFYTTTPLISGHFDPVSGSTANANLNIGGILTVINNKVLTANDANVGQACAAVTVGVSPFAYTATLGGDVAVAGGTVSGMTKTRAAVVVWNSLLSSDDIPVRAGDVITVTYTVAPTIYQCAN